jgi:hypothetical protein
MNNFHLVIFCGPTYKKFLPYCIHAIEENFGKDFLSKNIVSSFYFKYEGFNIMTDQDIWYDIDPNLDYAELFEFVYHRQQTIKLNLDRYLKGDILVVDCDLLFLEPLQFKTNGKYNLYTSIEYDHEYFNFIGNISGLGKLNQQNESFITDFGMFNSEVLYRIRQHIENYSKEDFMHLIHRTLHLDPTHSNNFSEYEIYGTYLMNKEPELINEIILPRNYIMRMDIDWENYDPSELLVYIRTITNNQYQCIDINKIEVERKQGITWS